MCWQDAGDLFIPGPKPEKEGKWAGDGADMVLWAQEISLHPPSCGADGT